MAQYALSLNPFLIAEMSIIHNHCAIELAIDNALYAMNVKMVFGNTPILHHLRHRSHEPRLNQPIWKGDEQTRQQNRQSYPPSNPNVSHPSLSLEITPLDVDSPNMSPDGSRLRFFPSILSSHQSNPTTPTEESRYRKRLLHSSGSGGVPFDWRGMTFTVMKPENSLDTDDAASLSPTLYRSEQPYPGMVDSMSDETNRLSMSITPPSTPSFTNQPLGSPSLSFSGRSVGRDASGTRRMMLRRKSSSFLRTSGSSPSSSTSSLESGPKTPYPQK